MRSRVDMRIRVLIFVVLIPLLFIVSARFYGLYNSNQNSSFAYGLYFSGEEFLDRDWYSHTQPNHLLFSYLVSGLNRLGILSAGAQLIELSLALCLVLALWGQVYCVARDMAPENSAPGWRFDPLLASATIFGVMVLAWSWRDRLETALQSLGIECFSVDTILNFKDGLAGQYIFAGYLQPSEFGILILAAIVLVQWERWRIAIFLLGLAAAMHSSYLLHAGVLVAISLGWLLRHGQRSLVMPGAVVFGLLTAPFFLYGLTFMLSQPDSAEAARILAQERIPHHALPEVWFWDDDAVLGCLMMGAAAGLLLLKNRGILRWIFAISVAYTAAGILLVCMTDSNQLALMFPWRASVYLSPLSSVILLSYLGVWMLKAAARLDTRAWIIAEGLVLIALTIGFAAHAASGIQFPEPEKPTEEAAVARQVHAITGVDDIVVMPPTWGRFRLLAMRSIYVDEKSPPFLPREVLEWWRRLNAVREFYDQAVIRRGDLEQMCATAGASYVVVPRDQSAGAPGALDNPVTATDDHLVFRCGFAPAP
jgi:hypothetical protein